MRYSSTSRLILQYQIANTKKDTERWIQLIRLRHIWKSEYIAMIMHG